MKSQRIPKCQGRQVSGVSLGLAQISTSGILLGPSLPSYHVAKVIEVFTDVTNVLFTEAQANTKDRVHMCVFVCVYLYVCVYLCVCACVLIGGPFGAGQSTMKPASLPVRDSSSSGSSTGTCLQPNEPGFYVRAPLLSAGELP